MIPIQYKQLAPDTLHQVLVEIVTRQGTDYGESEVPLDVKVEQLLKNLENGKALLIYDPKNDFIDVAPSENHPEL